MPCCYHFTLSAQYAADILPLAIFLACRALNASLRLEPSGEPLTPCWPKRMVLTCSPDLATTTCDLVGWPGVFFGLLKPETPALLSLGSFAIGCLLWWSMSQHLAGRRMLCASHQDVASFVCLPAVHLAVGQVVCLVLCHYLPTILNNPPAGASP